MELEARSINHTLLIIKNYLNSNTINSLVMKTTIIGLFSNKSARLLLDKENTLL